MRSASFAVALLLVAVVSRAETPLSPPAFGPAVHLQRDVAIASDGDRYFAAWKDSRNGRSYRLFGSVVSPENSLEPETGKGLIWPATHPDDAVRPSVVWNGRHYILVTADFVR